MKTLIVGAKGMLGTMLGEVFADWEPVLWDKEEIDITDLERVRIKVSGADPELIINAAAYTNVDAAEENREAAFAVNETGVKNLATVAREIGAHIVHYSTDYVFPGNKPEGYTEEDEPGSPLNVYGESKLAGEKALQESGAKFTLIRPAWLYGPYGKNFVNTMLELAKTKDKLSVVNDQHGSPTYTKDVAEATKKLLEEGYEPGIYHCVNMGVATWYDFAKKIFEIAGVSITVEPVSSDQFPRPAKRPQYSVLQNTKGPAMRPWEDALKDYLINK